MNNDSEHTARSDTGPFALVPEWVLDDDISDRALRLYCVLARYADRQGVSWPSRRTLASRLRCSVDSVDRAVKELVIAQALDVAGQFTADGDQGPNNYRVLRVRGRGPAATGGRGPAAQNESHPEREVTTSNEVDTPRWPQSVARKRVTDDEGVRALEVLDAWNIATGQDLRAFDWLVMIVGRIREYPEATLADHRFIIEQNLLQPWWQGPPNPSVVYGNGAQFERAIQTARNAQRDDDRLERIVEAVENRRQA